MGRVGWKCSVYNQVTLQEWHGYGRTRWDAWRAARVGQGTLSQAQRLFMESSLLAYWPRNCPRQSVTSPQGLCVVMERGGKPVAPIYHPLGAMTW